MILWKLRYMKRTFKVMLLIFKVRQCGTHVESGWDGDMDYQILNYRGINYKIPKIND